MPTIHRHTVMVTLWAVALLAVSGCGGNATTSTPTKTSTTPASPAASQTYSSRAFVVPLTVTVDAALKSPPNPDSPHLLSWDAAASEENKVRFLAPVIVYPPGDDQPPQAPPKDYLKFLQGPTKDNAELSEVTKITVDGHPATLITATYTIDAGHPKGSSTAPSAVPNAPPTGPRAASECSPISSNAWPSSTSARPPCSPGRA